MNYTIHFLPIANLTISASCTDNVCEYMVEVPPTVCQSSSDISTIGPCWLVLVCVCACVNVCVCVCV